MKSLNFNVLFNPIFKLKFKNMIYFFTFLTILISCINSQPKPKNTNDIQKSTYNNNIRPDQNYIQVKPLTTTDKIKLGEKIIFDISRNNNCPEIDSVILNINNKEIKTPIINNKIEINTTLTTGQYNYIFTFYFNNNTIEVKKFNYTIVAKTQPIQLSYKIINKYNHDKNAYTQGLIYENGIMYESTGLRGKSTLRKVNYTIGEVFQSINLPSDDFGEGIAIKDDYIYQLTWKSNIGYIYNKKTFSKINYFTYYTEGWGLAFDGKNLIMSDGSNTLYFLDPDNFNEIKRLEVYDDKNEVKYLNELEYVNDKIYANVYGKTYIVSINPETGEVMEKIDFSELYPQGYKGDYDKVLNGIAYNKQNNHFFITGKLWPFLYEIMIY